MLWEGEKSRRWKNNHHLGRIPRYPSIRRGDRSYRNYHRRLLDWTLETGLEGVKYCYRREGFVPRNCSWRRNHHIPVLFWLENQEGFRRKSRRHLRKLIISGKNQIESGDMQSTSLNLVILQNNVHQIYIARLKKLYEFFKSEPAEIRDFRILLLNPISLSFFE